jgi:hypothetical protein
MDLYGHHVQSSGKCVLVTAEDSAEYLRYILQQVLRNGVETGQLTAENAARAKADVRIIGWKRSRYGPLVTADTLGAMRRMPAYDLLLELLTPIKPVYVTFDPAVLFGPGERHASDGDSFLASMLNETALEISACMQLVDHVVQGILRGGIVDQYAARGSTAKTDNARLGRQLVRITPRMVAEGHAVPPGITADDLERGRALVLHTTKPNYAEMAPPIYLLRHRYWIETLGTPSPSDAVARETRERQHRDSTDLETIVSYLRVQLCTGTGIRHTRKDLEDHRQAVNGKLMSRARVREAIKTGIAKGRLKEAPLPPEECRGARKTYIAPADPST